MRVLSTVALLIASASASAFAAPMPSRRQTIELASGWRFTQNDHVVDAQAPSFPDEGWVQVQVPHTWNRVGYYIPNPQNHVNRADNVDKSQGVGWYRLHFVSPVIQHGKAWLEFDAASRVADVWLNGVKLGQHSGGFSRFRFDASSAIRPGASNVLAVRVDNTQPKPGTSTADNLPLTGDFFVYGGLYRPVRLVLTDAVHIDMLDHGGPGLYARTARIKGRTAFVEVRSRVRNDSPAEAAISVSASLIDTSGRVAGKSTRALRLSGGASAEAAAVMNVPDAHLWQGVADPHLYTLRVELRSANGRLLDALDQPFGIRQMRFDPSRGFILNGKPVRLHGVGLHQDYEGKGWALSQADLERTFSIIREMGANTIRLTHYQHDEATHALADRYGIILWDEIPLVTAWTISQDQTQASDGLAANARQQLQELIRQNYNHPSVAVWGIANEVDFGRGRPDFLGNAPPFVPDPLPFLRSLDQLAKSEDPDRQTVTANCCEERGMPDVPITAEAADAAGVNRYFGWYYGTPKDLGSHLDLLHAKRPEQPLAVSEYGAGGAVTIHTDDPLGGPIDMGGATQPEEYQAWVHEQSWKVLKTKPYLWATWLWNGFDFASTVRTEGDSKDINTKGLVTFDRKVKKDAFYFYKANWTSAPTVHINGRRYIDRAYPVTEVRVYSNAARTALAVNGRSLGFKSNCPDRICVWPLVRLETGRNKLVASARFGGRTVQDEILWNLARQSAEAFRIDSGSILAASSHDGRFGSDAFFDGGSVASVDRHPRGRPPVLAAVSGTEDRDLAATYREGDFHYRIPVSNGTYTVTLTFIDPGGSKRVFDVVANGRNQFGDMDVAAEAGGPLVALRKSFDVVVTDGSLDLHFQPTHGKALVSAIAVARKH